MLKKLIEKVILSRRKEIPFIIFFSFLVTFFIARVIAYSIHTDTVPDFLPFLQTVYIKGYHIHHFNFGIVLLAASGFLSLIAGVRQHVRKIAVLYGVGLSLIADEFGLLVTLNSDVYWNRRSYDIVILIGFVLLNIVYFRRFWLVMGGRIKRIFFKK